MSVAQAAEISRRRFSVRGFFTSWLILICLSALWSFATPISGAPDEPSHLIKAASVARGQLLGADVSGGQLVTVPAYIAYSRAQSCFAFKPTKTPECAPPLADSTDADVAIATSAGLYNPMYYFLVGWPTLLFHDQTGIYAVRIVSGLLGSVFLAACVGMILCWRWYALPLLGLTGAITPMVLFMNGVVNPSSLEATATLAAFVGMLSIFLHPCRSLLSQRSIIVFVSAAVAINTRGISPLWVAAALFLPFILASRAQIRELAASRAVRLATAGIALALAAALTWTRLSNSLGAGLHPSEDAPQVAGMGDSPLQGFSLVLNGTLQYGKAIIGEFGWLDTPAPDLTFFVWSAVVLVVVIAGLSLLRGRQFVLALSLVAAVILLPPVIQALYIRGGGLIWQGRYTIPLFICAIVGITALIGSRTSATYTESLSSRRLIFFSVLSLFAAQVFAFIFTLKRYAVGFGRKNDLSWGSVFLHPEWSPPGTTILLAVLFVLVSGFALGLVYRSVTSSSNRSLEPGELA